MQDKRVSVVLMTYAEKGSIRGVIEDFFATGVVDEVVVVNNNAEMGTSAEVAKTRARQVFETRQGYGFAIRRGLAEAKGELIVLAEPDGTFLADDIRKLLAYEADFDAVFGSRTVPQLLWHGANMGWPLKWGNWAVAKLVTVLFRTGRLTDVGCTYKLLSRSTVAAVLPLLKVGGSESGPELMLQTILSGARWVEIPVNYLPRVGVSSVTGDLRRAMALGLRMVALIIKIRLATLGRTRTHGSFNPVRRSKVHLEERRGAVSSGPLGLRQPRVPGAFGIGVMDIPPIDGALPSGVVGLVDRRSVVTEQTVRTPDSVPVGGSAHLDRN